MTRTLLAWFVLAGLGAGATAEIEIRQVTLGLPASGPSGAVYRSGSWAPAAVEVVLSGGAARNVRLHIEQPDLDGDIVTHEKFTALTPELSGPQRVHWLYFVPHPDTPPGFEGFKVQILDDSTGEPLEVIHNQEQTRKVLLKDLPELVPADTFVVLNVGEGTAGYTKRLSDFTEGQDRSALAVRVAHISPDGLPDHWHGLEMVDALVWDDADPSGLSEHQMAAVLEWVKQGGHLLVAAARTADLLAGSPLAAILPCTLRGGASSETELPESLGRLDWDRPDREEAADRRYAAVEAIHTAECQARPGVSRAIRSAGETRTYAARWDVERGSVVFVGLRLADLFDQLPGADPVQFYKRALSLRGLDRDPDSRFMGMMEPIDLIDHLRTAVDFQTRATLYLFIIVSFVLAYIVLAAGGTWLALRRFQGLKYSWPAFGIVAAVASAVSLAAVRINSGLGQKLDQLTILDSTVDTYAASGLCYFGLKTSTMDQLDLWLPSGWEQAEEPQYTSCFLRAMPPRTDTFGRGELRFADPQRYRSRSIRAALDDVPMRATLKQFEGYWQGSLSGQLHAEIRMLANPPPRIQQSRIAPGSFLTNDLGHDLQRCFLFESRLDPDHGASRDTSILVHYIPRIANGERLVLDETLLGEELDADVRKADATKEPNLQNLQRSCINSLNNRLLGPGSVSFGGRQIALGSSPELAALLLSTYAEFTQQVDERNFGGVGPDLVRTHGQTLDRSRDIRRDQLLLLAFSNEAGPAVLRARRGDAAYRPVAARSSTIVHRFTIPVSRN